jgi:oxygen-independent coproporphyrinogen III oxidase
MEPTSLYIHVPFCSGKCFYCDFYSIPAEPDLIASYLRALNREVKFLRERFFEGQKPLVKTIFIGGGTPTSLAPRDLADLGRIIDENCRRPADCEFTCEANPESVTGEKIQALQAAGLNRFSLGAQTFDDQLLKVIGRRHTSRQTYLAVDLANTLEVKNISLDLIYALPNQTPEEFTRDLDTAVNLPLHHLSCYELTYEPGTKLYSSRTGEDQEDQQVEMFRTGHRFLTAQGFDHYEISNYARPGFYCRHNMRYWKNLDYLGLGPSAAGFINHRRYKNETDLKNYCRRLLEQNELPVASQETLPPLQFAGETAMLALRTTTGIEKNDFSQQTGYNPFDLFQHQIEKYQPLGLLETTPDRIFLTLRGMTLSNEVLADFL